MIVSGKKKGSAVVEFATVRAAVSIIFSYQCPHCFSKHRHLDRSTFVYYSHLIIITNDTSQRPPSLRTVPVIQKDVFDSFVV